MLSLRSTIKDPWIFHLAYHYCKAPSRAGDPTQGSLHPTLYGLTKGVIPLLRLSFCKAVFLIGHYTKAAWEPSRPFHGSLAPTFRHLASSPDTSKQMIPIMSIRELFKCWCSQALSCLAGFQLSLHQPHELSPSADTTWKITVLAYFVFYMTLGTKAPGDKALDHWATSTAAGLSPQVGRLLDPGPVIHLFFCWFVCVCWVPVGAWG